MYLPCVLQTKKRYVGFMYESRDQMQPTYHAKGIETVRRDTCPAVSKVCPTTELYILCWRSTFKAVYSWGSDNEENSTDSQCD